jgi:Leucine-rich repeat (LRR) protein
LLCDYYFNFFKKGLGSCCEAEEPINLHSFKGHENLIKLKLKKSEFLNAAVFDSLPNLIYLELDVCSRLNEINVKLPPSLTHLHLICYKRKYADDIKFDARFLSNLPKLNWLKISEIPYYGNQKTESVTENDDSITNDESLCWDLPSLTTLKIYSNSIPFKCWSQLTSLTHLYLKEEADYADGFKALVNLKTLSLRSYSIKELPADIFVNQKQLESLILCENKLEELNCEAFNGLDSLKVLDLNSNRLRNFNLVKLDQLLAKLPGLEELDLSYNKIENFESILNKITELNIRFPKELTLW